MRLKAKRYMHKIWVILRNGVLGIIIMIVFLLLPPLTVLAGVVCWAVYQDHTEFQSKLRQSVALDQRHFPQLPEPALIYTRDHSPMYGNTVLVYRLDQKLWPVFERKIEDMALSNTVDVECVKPTVRKRWRGWRTTLHYVQPNPAFLSHEDYLNHDSYLVIGSAKYLANAVNACQQVFKVISADREDISPRYAHRYWAVSEQEHLLFSVYSMNY